VKGQKENVAMSYRLPGLIDSRGDSLFQVVVVLTLGSHDAVNQVDHRYLAYCHCHGPPSFKENREVGEDCL